MPRPLHLLRILTPSAPPACASARSRTCTPTAHPHLASVAAAAVVLACLGGCSPGPRERTLAAREAVVTSDPGSAEIAYFHVLEDLPRTSLDQPITATATALGDSRGLGSGSP